VPACLSFADDNIEESQAPSSKKRTHAKAFAQPGDQSDEELSCGNKRLRKNDFQH
jgi:hypothetical protein